MEIRRFETSHVLGAHLASSPLLPQSWRQCSLASAAAVPTFLLERIGNILYVAFPGVQTVQSITTCPNFFAAEPIATAGHGLFSPLVDDEHPVLVHSASLHLFLAISNSPEFEMLKREITNTTVIFTGHSIGGSLASLAALYFLCSSSASNSPSSVLCITFGSPMLGNEALSRAVQRERFAGNFCHVATQHDLMPRLLFCPPNSISPQLISRLIQSWQFLIRHPRFARPSSCGETGELHLFVSMHIAAAAAELNSGTAEGKSLYRPFGSYVLCSAEGAVCIDNPAVVVRMLYLTFVTGAASSGVEEEHLSYGDLVVRISQLLLVKKTIAVADEATISNYAASISLALQASGIGIQDMGAMEARECLKMSKRMGRTPNLNCANLAIRLAKITPCRAQIEWYKASCDDLTGYYDSFKYRKASKKDSKINMNRIKLARFWDDLIDMLNSNQLPHDFLKRSKWVNAAQFYKLLVEPLDIAEYYRSRACKTKGHYLTHGRERRYELFDKWWREREKTVVANRSKFAGLTQDSCFWARVEEAKEWAENARTEKDAGALRKLYKNLLDFDCYARHLIQMKEVSRDVLAPNSSYSLWVEEWRDLKLSLGLQMPP